MSGRVRSVSMAQRAAWIGGLRGGFMRKAREPAKNEFQEQLEETASQGAQPMATTRYPKRALADDADQGPAQGPQQTAIVRTRSGAHHHHRREPAVEAA